MACLLLIRAMDNFCYRLGHHVHFDVDKVAFPLVGQDDLVLSMSDQHDGEGFLVIVDVCKGQADAVQGDVAFGHQTVHQLRMSI